MENERLSIHIDGEEMTDAYDDLAELEVELDDELAGMFRMRLNTQLQDDGTWLYLDDERFRVWKEATISMGFETGTEEILSGFITHVKPHFDPSPSRCSIEIWGLDRSVVMDREEKLKDWPDKTDSDIATEILSAHQFTPQVEATEVAHDVAVSTVIQRETDMQFLKRLALRNGFECWVDGTDAFFGPPALDDDPQPILAVHFGCETNVRKFELELNALVSARVGMAQLDRTSNELLEASAESSEQTALGDLAMPDLLSADVEEGLIYVAGNTATGEPEMTALCQGLHHQAEWFLTGEGELDGNEYGHVLKPRATVTIKGIGETYSGVYYVCHVTHKLAGSGYAQTFKVRRNGILPTGDEDFAGDSGFLGGLL